MPDQFIKLPKDVMARTDINLTAKVVYAAIVDRFGRNGESWPSLDRIASDVGCRRSTVQCAIVTLRGVGLIEVVSRGPGRGHSNVYRIPRECTGNRYDTAPEIHRESVHSENLNVPEIGTECTGNRYRNVPEIGNEPDQGNQTKELDQSKTLKSPLSKSGPTKTDAEAIRRAYPRKVGKAAALKAISKALKAIAAEGNPDPASWLLERTTLYAKSPAGQQEKYTPHPSTWFNQGRYHDDDCEWSRAAREPKSVGRIAAEPGKYDRFK